MYIYNRCFWKSCSTVSLCVFIVEDHLFQVFEVCLPFGENAFQAIVLVLNVCFLGPFFLRMVLAPNMRAFLLSKYTVADYHTIPPAILGVILGRSFIGLQFMRMIFVLKTEEMGGYAETSRGFLIRKYLSRILTLWFMVAGLIHFIEGLDNQLSSEKPHDLRYGTWLYFTAVTVTTVGYGDVTCKTMIVRFFLTISLPIAMVLYGKYLPDLVRMIYTAVPDFKPYRPILSGRHIVFCGYLNAQKIRTFIKTGINRDADLVFLGDCTPCENRESPLQGLHPVQGLVQDGRELAAEIMLLYSLLVARLNSFYIHEAHACIFLSNQKSKDQEGEDFRNINSALDVSRSTTSPVHLELLQCKSKKLFDKVFQPRPEDGNVSVFCYAEFKLKLMGYSCLVPGFSTLLANLILPDMVEDMDNQTHDFIWEEEYNFGRSSLICTTCLSDSFESMTLHEAVELCHKKLGLILLGIEIHEGHNRKIIVYPSNPCVVIPQNTVGYFCNRGIEILQRASIYCSLCHGSQDEEGLFDGPCKCDKIEKRKQKLEAQDSKQTSLRAEGDFESVSPHQEHGGYDVWHMDGQCNFCQRLPVLVSHITDEPMAPVSDTLAVAVGQTIPPALFHSFAYLNYGRSDVLSFACTLMQGGLSPKSLVEQGYDEVQVRLLDPVDLKDEAINSRGTYEEVFRNALYRNMLCLGLYRELDESSEVPPLRYVITNPEEETVIYETDLVFVLCRKSKVHPPRGPSLAVEALENDRGAGSGRSTRSPHDPPLREGESEEPCCT
ncbi:LOW QUALITY PROTEIN: calcium-activated potassium channel slowpoke-like [Penaeus monodon]|uniref:LOW QUALITY PROTEIN: calcium-activated potassium channel slowpoke-like n=1 Tax=Penaeus monodon TaxID=6687 RepID=UPI0018A7D3F9|nr:LOW QUALITY PROTEIN: calcium-activated potassium channel slowpoke-like [Penaeus monodon]